MHADGDARQFCQCLFVVVTFWEAGKGDDRLHAVRVLSGKAECADSSVANARKVRRPAFGSDPGFDPIDEAGENLSATIEEEIASGRCGADDHPSEAERLSVIDRVVGVSSDL